MQYIILPPTSYLWQVFSYDPPEGILRWKRRPFKRSILFEGRPAGIVNMSGHRSVHLDRVVYYAHRLIWKMMTGSDPVEQIDHKNGDHDDNRWENLREATIQQQRFNQGMRYNNTSGIIGVFYENDRRKWKAQAGFDGKRLNLGRYDTKEEAIEAYRRFAESKHKEFLHPENRTR